MPNKKNAMSLEDFLENGGRLASPRSIEACLRSGLEPNELRPKKMEDFIDKKVPLDDLEREAAQIRFKHFEEQRQKKIELLKKERKKVIKEIEGGSISTSLRMRLSPEKKKSNGGEEVNGMGVGLAVGSSHPSLNHSLNHSVNQSLNHSVNHSLNRSLTSKKDVVAVDSTMVAMEQKRLEAIKARQEKEIQALIDLETKTAEMARANEEREKWEKKRQEQWEKERKQRLQESVEAKKKRELKKKEEEEKEVIRRKELAKREAEKERLLLEQEEKESKVRAREAREREVERRLKAEEHRFQTEALLKAQEDLVAQNRQRMLEKEQLVKEKMELAQQKRAQEALERRRKAEQRIQEALMTNQAILEKKKNDFDAKQALVKERARELQMKQKEAILEQQEQLEAEEKIRMQRLKQAQLHQKQRIQRIVSHRNKLENHLEQVHVEQEREHILKTVEKNLILQEKRETVERIQRADNFRRQQLLSKIVESDEKTKLIKEKKKQLIEARKNFALQSVLRKHKIGEAVEHMRVTNKWTSIDKVLEGDGKKGAKKSPKKSTPIET